MRAIVAIQRSVFDLRQIVEGLNRREEYESAARAQSALIMVDQVLQVDAASDLEEIEVTEDASPVDPQRAMAALLPRDRNPLRDAISWLRDVPETNGNFQNAQATREHLVDMLSRVPR